MYCFGEKFPLSLESCLVFVITIRDNPVENFSYYFITVFTDPKKSITHICNTYYNGDSIWLVLIGQWKLITIWITTVQKIPWKSRRNWIIIFHNKNSTCGFYKVRKVKYYQNILVREYHLTNWTWFNEYIYILLFYWYMQVLSWLGTMLLEY